MRIFQPIITGSLTVTNGVTASFTGSYIGDGAGLYNIPASGIVGLNLSQISSGSVSASISPSTGLQVNTNVTATSFTGSLSGSALSATSASYALTASYVANASSFPYTGSALITGSLGVTGSTIFEDNNSTSVVRITQLGTGDALRVEDSTNPDSTPTIINQSGSIYIGTGSVSGTGADTKLYVKAGSAGSITYAVVPAIAVENSTTNYIYLQAPDANFSGLAMGSPSDGFGAYLRWGYNLGKIQLGAAQSGHGIEFIVGNKVSSSLQLTPNISTTTDYNATLNLTGSFIATSITASRAFISSSNGTVSGSTLTVYGSGSAQPVFTVQGSQGELFSITDSLSGSLFSVNDISGLPILEVFSDNTILQGNYLAPSLNTTAKVTQTNSGSFVMYSLPTASYDTAFFEYSVRSGSNARAGTIMAIQSGSAVNFTETTTTDFGSTSAISFTVVVTGSNMALTGSSTSGAWTIKTIVRGL